MRLLDIIQGKLIIPHMRAQNKWDAIEELVDQLAAEHEIRIFDRPEVLDEIITREKSQSTGLEHGVALPHGRTRAVDDLVGVFGISPEGIPFDSKDGKPAKLLCLLLIPHDQYSDHIQTLARLSKFLSDAATRRTLIQAGRTNSMDKVLKAIERFEGPDYLRD